MPLKMKSATALTSTQQAGFINALQNITADNKEEATKLLHEHFGKPDSTRGLELAEDEIPVGKEADCEGFAGNPAVVLATGVTSYGAWDGDHMLQEVDEEEDDEEGD